MNHYNNFISKKNQKIYIVSQHKSLCMTGVIAARSDKICCAGTAIATIILFLIGLTNGIVFFIALFALGFGLCLYYSQISNR